MFHQDDSFAEPSLSGAESSARRYLQMGTANSFVNNCNYDEFSFKLNHSGEAQQKSLVSYQSQNNTFSLQQNLELMEKHQIIELFLEQIKSVPQKKVVFSYHDSERPSPKTYYGRHNQNQAVPNFKKQYQELVKDFEEYISNTREAQDHFIRTIEELKKQNQDLQRSINKGRSQNQNGTKAFHYKQSYSQFSQSDKNPIINKLQQTIEKYLEINNELIGKVQKLQRAHEQDSNQITSLKKTLQKLQFECDTLDKQNVQLQNQNENFRNIIEELKEYIKEKRQAKDLLKNDQSSFCIITQRLKDLKNHKPSDSIMQSSQIKRNSIINDSSFIISNPSKPTPENLQLQPFNAHDYHSNDLSDIQIQNKELKLTNMKLEGFLEKKSQKIRQLLEQIQSISEEKMLMKQEILELKSGNKENMKIGELKEDQSINETLSGIGGIKMASSSIYSLKNSQSTCLETSKGPKQEETMRQLVKQPKSAIRQAYNNCFKKSSEGKQSTIEQSGQKVEQIKKQACYLPRVNQFSSKKSSEGPRGGNEIRNEVKVQSFGVIRKRSQIQS